MESFGTVKQRMQTCTVLWSEDCYVIVTTVHAFLLEDVLYSRPNSLVPRPPVIEVSLQPELAVAWVKHKAKRVTKVSTRAVKVVPLHEQPTYYVCIRWSDAPRKIKEAIF